MKNPRLPILFFLMLAAGTWSARPSTNSLQLRYRTGTEKTTSLSSLSKISFSNDQMVLAYSDGTFESVDLLTVRSIGFSIETALQSLQSVNGLSTYTLSGKDRVVLTGIPEGASTALLYRMDGRLVKTVALAGSTQDLDVSGLSQGLYLIRVGGLTVKFVRQ